MYLYFKTKEELFKAVIRGFVVPRLSTIRDDLDAWPGSMEDYLRGPFLERVSALAKSQVVVLFRLLIAEGPKHPDLTRYYHQHVVSRGLALLRDLIQRGVDAGEFRPNPVSRYPHLIMAPVLFSVCWRLVFQRHDELDIDALLEAHIDNLLLALKSAGDSP